MTRELEIDLSQNMIAEPWDAYRVEGDHFGLATAGDKHPYIVTCGIFACKAIVVYDPGERKGLVGHLSTTQDLEADLSKIVHSFGNDLSGSDVTLLQAYQTPRSGWPKLGELYEYFLSRNPRSLIVDRNAASTSIRGLALRLSSGEVKEIDSSKGWLDPKTHDLSINQFLS